MTKKNYELMAEYLIPRLEAGGQKFDIGQSNLEGIGPLHLLKQDDSNRRIFLIDREFTGKEYKLLLNIASGRTQYHGRTYNYDHESVFFKDGKTYFRSAAFGDKAGLKGVKYKQTKHLSLKDYSDDEIKRMIYMSQPELVQLERYSDVTYYQPKSERLEEAVLRYKFGRTKYNNDNVMDFNKFAKSDYSTRIYINKLIEQYGDKILLNRGRIIDAGETDLPKDNRLF